MEGECFLGVVFLCRILVRNKSRKLGAGFQLGRRWNINFTGLHTQTRNREFQPKVHGVKVQVLFAVVKFWFLGIWVE